MAYKRVVAAAFFAALMAATSVQAQTTVNVGCRKKCDASFSTCSKRAKAGDNACLRTWHKCKTTCTGVAAVRPAKATLASQVKREARPRRERPAL